MASSSVPLLPSVDDFYFSALFDDDEIFPISDEKYAEELALQEALISATLLRTPKMEVTQEYGFVPPVLTQTLIHRSSIFEGKRVKLESTGQPSQDQSVISTVFCIICMDAKPAKEMFTSTNCTHSFCSDCVGKHVAAKIQENIATVTCPEPSCDSVLEPHLCRSIVPRPVFERWGSALCESVVLGWKRLYCPFKDCPAMMVDEGSGGGTVVAVSECPSCHRLFCAQCEVPWHFGVECSAFQAERTVNGQSSAEKEGEKLVVELAQQKNWRRCPGCKFYIEKNEGCLHITCRCGNEFCYKCGSKWSSSHSC